MFYMPEFFDADKETNLAARRDTFLSQAVRSQGRRRSLVLFSAR
ncbi:hypothetical protein DFI02_104315 [Rhizobium sp. PP-F2F-G20b]|nr:hypothetical protein DFI02_104315 [Rhizobium sp. PP-F2F-G20b]